MVYLTFIRQANRTTAGCISFDEAKQLFLLSKVLIEKFGKPRNLIASAEDEGIYSAQIVNLLCGVHCIHSTSALTAKASLRSMHAFLSFLFKECAQNGAQHVIIVLSNETFSKLAHQTLLTGNSCTFIMENWRSGIDDYISLWFPLKNNAEDATTVGEIANQPLNLPLSASDAVLIKKTIKEASVVV